MILNKAQAQAVYNAMCSLNNLGSAIGFVRIPGARAQEDLQVRWDNGVDVQRGVIGGRREEFDSQAAFAGAYGLDI